MKKTPSPEQLDALVRFAARHGRNWKSALNQCWFTGYYGLLDTEDDSAYLQQVRNTFGPGWLVRFSLPKGGS